MKQFDSKDCSLYVIKYFYDKFYDSNLPISKLKANSTYSSEGIKLNSVKELCSDFGLFLSTYKCDFNELTTIDKSEYPIAILVNNNGFSHLIILIKKVFNLYYIYDPINGYKWLNHSDLSNIYGGLIIEIKRNYNYKKEIVKNQYNIHFNLYFFLICFIGLLAKITSPLISKIFMTNLYFSYAINPLLITLILFAWFTIITQIFYSISYKLINKRILKTVEKKQAELLENIQKNKYKTIYKYNDSEILLRFETLKPIEEFKVSFLSNIIIDLVSILVSVYYLYQSNNYVLISIMSYGFISVLSSTYISLNIRKWSNSLKELYSLNMIGLLDFFNLNRTINSKNTNYLLLNKNKKILSQYNLISSNLSHKLNFWNSFHGFFHTLFPFVIYTIAIILYWNKSIPIYQFIFYLSGISLITDPLKSVNDKINIWNQNKQNLEILNTFNFKISNEKTSLNIDKQDPISIEINNLKLNWKDKKTLDIKNLIIDKNTHIIGSNGSGKSSLAKILVGVYDFYEGLVNIVIKNKKYDLNYYESHIFIINPDQYFPNISIEEFLTESSPNKKAYKDLIFKKYDLDLLLNEANIKVNSNLINNASNLSTGQKRIILFLKAMIEEPKIIILDEAFENINFNISKFMKECLSDHLSGSLFIEISHSNNYVFNNSERIYIEKINEI
ncbi:Mbov_0121 family peptidase domain-containing ABC transporter [Mycoplasma crocodyli]|uniref:Mbov_0121 family peptidase domain-containing ABC transporter n=1 Tax=Mycoplasma crocodyli TaxID=50052 RepID=UPI0002F09CC7|nr:ATP-binding cassette domain-containing protein [Mycoplasma crocodyli]